MADLSDAQSQLPPQNGDLPQSSHLRRGDVEWLIISSDRRDAVAEVESGNRDDLAATERTTDKQRQTGVAAFARIPKNSRYRTGSPGAVASSRIDNTFDTKVRPCRRPAR